MADIIDRLHKILAMAESPVEEEARTAAIMAVRLIKKHNVQLSMPGRNTEDLFEHFRRPPPAAKPPKPPPPPPKSGRVPRFGERPVPMTAKYISTCRVCGKDCFEGDRVWWLKGHGVTHRDCDDSYWYEEQEPW